MIKNEKINKETKINNERALAKIKVKINKYFEDIGRDIFDDIDMARIDLIDDIEDVLDNTEISPKQLILEKFDLENETKNNQNEKRK